MYVLGIDIGTTGTKSMLIDSHGKILKSSYREYSLITPGGYIEQNANDWWETVVTTVRACIEGFSHTEEIAALSMSTQGGSLVFVDEDGTPLNNAITWMDARGNDYLPKLFEKIPETEIYRISGWKPSGALCATKLMWIKEHRNDLINGSYKMLTTVDFVNFRLTGKFAIDQTNAGIMQIFDINTCDWSDKILSAVGFPRGLLPDIVPTGEIIGNLTHDAAEQLGLTTKTIVVSGAHDQYAAATGAGAVNPGDVLLSTGTAWAPLGISDKLTFDDKSMVGVGNHTVPGLYGVLCTVPGAGVSLEWLRKHFSAQKIDNGHLRPDSFAEIDIEAASRRDKCKNLFFFPHWNGSAFPRWNAKSKASFIGLSLEHDFYDEALAIMEGIAFEAKLILDGYAAIGSPAKALRLVGGASKSPLWTNVISAVTGLPITRFKEANIACIGAAAIAGTAAGVFSSVNEAVANTGEFVEIPAPAAAEHEFYLEKFERYSGMIPLIEKIYNGKAF